MVIKKKFIVVLSCLFLSVITCKNTEKIDLKGKWSWFSISQDSTYFEAMISDVDVLLYYHGFSMPREYKIIGDTIYIDKIEDGYDLRFKISKKGKDKFEFSNPHYPFIIKLSKLNDSIYFFDSIKSDEDLDRYELDYNTRKTELDRHGGLSN